MDNYEERIKHYIYIYIYISEEHFKLLEHGLSFCPTRKYIDQIKICHDNERFCRYIRLHEYFPSRAMNYSSSVKTNKSWTPPECRCEHMDSLIKKLEITTTILLPIFRQTHKTTSPPINEQL